MKVKSKTIGIWLVIVLSILTTPSLCQVGLPNLHQGNKDCFFCADSLEYIGIVKLYSEYNSLVEINNDLELRFNLLDKSYLECKNSLNIALNRLELTNENRDSLLIENKELFLQTTDYKNKLKSWKIFGVSVSVSLIGIITALVLT